jgi:hypothetical protein
VALSGKDASDELIEELVQTARQPTNDETNRLIERLATAPFAREVVRVPEKHRGLTYVGRTIGAREGADFYHLVKRVLVDEQWAAGTSLAEFVADLRAAVRSPDADLVVYRRRGGVMAAAFAPSAIPPVRLGPRPQPFIYVLYSVERSTIVSGYQASGLAAISVPGDARWLR